MKILFLNPLMASASEPAPIVASLRARGVAVLLSVDAAEALQMIQLHGVSINLAVVHREGPRGNGEPGIDFITKIKQDPAQADLPLILSSEQWDDAQCVKHQNTPHGANAYLKAPFTDSEFFGIVDAVMGSSFSTAATPAVQIPQSAGQPASQEGGLVLEDAVSVFQGSSLNDANASAFEFSLVSHSFDDEAQGAVELAAAPIAASEPQVVNCEPQVNFDASAPESVREIQVVTFEPEGAQDPVVVVEPGLAFKEPGLAFKEPGLAFKEPGLACEEMPYLGGDMNRGMGGLRPIGDSVVPGGAAQSPDVETLKRYLFLREQDVAALSGQLKSARQQIQAVEDLQRMEHARNVELSHVVSEQKRRIDDFDREKAVAFESFRGEIAELKFQMKTRTDKARILEIQVREAASEMERLKERVRTDIRKIRVREKELENRLELMKKDSEALLGARESKIIELKRKLDLLEFNMDLLQDQYSREKTNSTSLRERLIKAAQVVRVAGGLLDSGSPTRDEMDERSEDISSGTTHEQAAS